MWLCTGKQKREGQDNGTGLRGTTTTYKIHKLQGYIAVHSENGHYFITLNGV